MKKSNIQWIGEIPDDWEITKIGQLYKLRNQKVSDRDYPPLSVTMNGIVPQMEHVAKTNAHDDRKLVRKGDFAINSRSDRRGSCGISKYDGSVSLINTVLQPLNEMNPNYYDWLFHTIQFSDEFYKWGHGIVDDLWSTNWQDMKNISVCVPPLSTQTAIATYLDAKCSEIDGLIADINKQIETLNELKKSTITEAVTKGLNKNVKLKDSGIQWIGEIPEGWRVSRVGMYFDIILGKMLCSTPLSNNYSLCDYYCALNVHFGSISKPEKKMWFNEFEKKQYRVRNNDLLVVEGGAGAGGCAIVKDLDDEVYIQNSVMIVRPKKDNDIRFVCYLIESLVKRNYVDIVCNKATIPHFTKEKLSKVPLTLPPLAEQQSIATYLDSKCSEFDSIISDKQKQISTLEAYKKSLIYEYVTGKKKVE